MAWAFEQFMQSLELTDSESAEATRQQQEVFLRMQQQLRPQEAILSGSYGRNTAIRPLHDIDLFLVFPTDAVPPRHAPHDYLKQVLHALQAAYPHNQPRLQNRSVNIQFKGTGIGFDVVPAMEAPQQRNVYWIPDRSRDTWVCSNPRRHWEVCAQANERTNKKLKPLIKAIKRWNQLQNKPASSFHLEVMAYEGLATEPRDYASGLAGLFQFMSERIQRLTPEPAGLGPPVDNGLDTNRREQARQRLTGAASKAAHAVDRERVGDLSTAHQVWHELLGPDYRGW
ncbi:nucleotidyltransferase domain-containing protein [Cystobacter ferrugineus]|uniref:nucleotidyltransferase domain-containing protein n=1 Tax=Cystobacter ferrugineus TaxID=83449 RepID=UPI00165176F8|nr:nucleotidyltransferase [Cystobacter ferrugineus]